jgi:glycosyltransferase involved in cell wall biosynthesis
MSVPGICAQPGGAATWGGTVGVIIPMFNSAATIDETLASVHTQTYRDLEIVVVDDGSSDGSNLAVRRWMQRDSRIRLVKQPNQGVAAARNTGAAATTAPLLAFLDADDLWAPGKIAEQVAVLAEDAQPRLVYCWFTQIDVVGRVLWNGSAELIEGDVLQRLCRINFVGNGSSMLMPREIFDAVGGFDSGLRAAGAQGCEDLLFQLRAAEQFEFRCVPKRLVGYRQTNANMSGDALRMVRSCEMVLDTTRARHPHLAPEMALMLRDVLSWMVYRGFLGGRLISALQLLRRLYRLDPSLVRPQLRNLAKSYIRGRLLPDWLVKRVQSRLARPDAARPPYLDLSW